MSEQGEARALYKLFCFAVGQTCEPFRGCGFPECGCVDRCIVYDARLKGEIK